MNKTAFLALIMHLQKNFTREKIDAYIQGLEKLKNDKSDASIALYKDLYMQKRTLDENVLGANNGKARTEENENGEAVELMDTGLLDFDNKEMLVKQRANAVDHAIYCLRWLSELTTKLNGELAYESLEKQMNAVREHFSKPYEEMYEILNGDDTWREREERLQENHLANYYLAPAVVGGPTFDDHTIYWFMKSFALAISGELHEKEVSPLQKTLTEVVNKMAYGDLGLDQITSGGIEIFEKIAPDINTDPDNLTYGGRKVHFNEGERDIYNARREIEKQRFPELFEVDEIKDAEKEMAELSLSFFEKQMGGKKLRSENMTALLKSLNAYKEQFNQQNGNLPKQTISVEVFDYLQKLTNKIRDEHRETNAKDFHETAEFLNRVDVYCEKMARLALSKENSRDPKANLSEQIHRTRDLSDRLFKHLDSFSKGNQSPEFRKMYEALDALRSGTAGSARHLLEQMLDAKNAADRYLRAKDEERLHKTGIRYTSKGQARYDSARNIRDMLDAALRPYRLAYDKHPHLNFLNGKDLNSGEKNKNHLVTDTYSFPKEYYLHRAGHALAMAGQIKRAQDTAYKICSSAKGSYDSYAEQYFYNMCLADHPEKRRNVFFEDEGKNAMEIGCNKISYQSEIVQPFFKYFLIVQNAGKDFTDYNNLFFSKDPNYLKTEEGKEEILNSPECKQLIEKGVKKESFFIYNKNNEITRVTPVLSGSGMFSPDDICTVYQQVSKENEYLKSIEKMTLQEARKLRTDTAGMEKSVNKFAEGFGYDETDETGAYIIDAIANRAKTDRIKALDKRINELTMARPQKHKAKRKVNNDIIIENPEPIDDNKPVRHISLG